MTRKVLFVVASAVALWAQPSRVAAQDAQVDPKMFGLGDNTNRRTAEPSELRAYPGTKDGKADRSTGPVWPRADSEDKTQYRLKENEVAVYHGAIDISSRGPDGKPVAREFTAGVYGMVLASRPGFVAVQMADGNIVQYVHASEVRLKPGQAVKPDTILGETGNLSASGKALNGTAIHLHIQVTTPDGKLVDPDRAILVGRVEKQDRTIKWVKPDWVDVGPMLIDSKRPKIGADGVVKADAANKKLYYDESAPKGNPVDTLAGSSWEDVGANKISRFDFAADSTFKYTVYGRSMPQPLVSSEGMWRIEGKNVYFDGDKKPALLYDNNTLKRADLSDTFERVKK